MLLNTYLALVQWLTPSSFFYLQTNLMDSTLFITCLLHAAKVCQTISSVSVTGQDVFFVLVLALVLPASLDHDSKHNFLKQIHFRYQQVKAFQKVQAHPLQIHEPALGPQIIMAIYKGTYGAILIGVTSHEADQLVDK